MIINTKPVIKPFLKGMTYSLIVLFFAFWAQKVDASNIASDTWLTQEQVKKDIALAKNAYETLHPGYTRYSKKSTMDNAWQQIEEMAVSSNGMSLGNFYLEVQKALTYIRCDHTKANLPKVLLNERDSQPMYLPFKWVWIEKRAFVTATPSQSALQPKDEILNIDGKPMKGWVDAVLPYIPYDGLTSWSRNSGVASSLEFKGGAVDHFGSLLFKLKPKVSITLIRDGQQQTIVVQRVNHKTWLEIDDNTATAANFKDAVHLEFVNDTTAYLRIDTFVNYRQPVKPETLYTPVFKSLKERGIKTLVLDLRNNGGGSSDASLGLFANLISEKRQAKVDMRVNTLSFDELKPYLWTWDKRALNPSRMGFSKNDDGSYSLRSFVTDEMDTIKPTKYAFRGQIIALSSNSNSSGSTNILANLKELGRTIIVGEKTGGSAEGPTAGVLFTLTLPESKVTTRIPFFKYTNNVQNPEFGMGLTPDVQAQMTAQAWLNEQDLALEKAKELALRSH